MASQSLEQNGKSLEKHSKGWFWYWLVQWWSSKAFFLSFLNAIGSYINSLDWWALNALYNSDILWCQSKIFCESGHVSSWSLKKYLTLACIFSKMEKYSKKSIWYSFKSESDKWAKLAIWSLRSRGENYWVLCISPTLRPFQTDL